MKTQNISAQNFNGGLYVVNKLSKKPAQCVEKEKSNLLELIRKEKFDLFIKQDYSKNVVNIRYRHRLSLPNILMRQGNQSKTIKQSEKTICIKSIKNHAHSKTNFQIFFVKFYM